MTEREEVMRIGAQVMMDLYDLQVQYHTAISDLSGDPLPDLPPPPQELVDYLQHGGPEPDLVALEYGTFPHSFVLGQVGDDLDAARLRGLQKTRND